MTVDTLAAHEAGEHQQLCWDLPGALPYRRAAGDRGLQCWRTSDVHAVSLTSPALGFLPSASQHCCRWQSTMHRCWMLAIAARACPVTPDDRALSDVGYGMSGPQCVLQSHRIVQLRAWETPCSVRGRPLAPVLSLLAVPDLRKTPAQRSPTRNQQCTRRQRHICLPLSPPLERLTR